MLQCSTELVCFGNTLEGITETYISSKNHLWSLTSHVGLIQYDLALASTSKTSGPGLEDTWPWPRPCCPRTHPCCSQ